MNVLAAAYKRDRLARIRLGLAEAAIAPAPKASRSRARLEPVDSVAARCVYCGAVARRRGVPVACHAHSDLPRLEQR